MHLILFIMLIKFFLDLFLTSSIRGNSLIGIILLVFLIIRFTL